MATDIIVVVVVVVVVVCCCGCCCGCYLQIISVYQSKSVILWPSDVLNVLARQIAKMLPEPFAADGGNRRMATDGHQLAKPSPGRPIARRSGTRQLLPRRRLEAPTSTFLPQQQ
jgi:hypothetical protein